MRSNRPVPHAAKSPQGWWIASYIERFEWRGASRALKARCLAYENTILLRAKDRHAAYSKAVRLGTKARSWQRLGDPPGRLGRWVFEGLTSLLPVYEKLGDGAELMWRVHRGTTRKAIAKRVKAKSNLESFNDADRT